MIERSDGCGSGLRLALLAGLVAAAAGSPAAADRRSGGVYGPLARAGARLAWQVALPLKFTTSIRSYHLVDEYLYAIGTDGRVRAVRADTGEHVWTMRITEPGTGLWPPTAYRSFDVNAVVFTLGDDVLFLAPATGLEVGAAGRNDQDGRPVRRIGPVRLASASVASVAVSPDYVFATSPGQRVGRYDIKNSYRGWQVGTPALLRLAPVYLGQYDLLLVTDVGGTLAGIDADDGERVFSRQLKGEPVGWLTADEEAVYVATTEPRLYALHAETGQVQLEYRLPGRPAGGPIVTETSVYQATVNGGVQRVGKEPDWKNWVVPEARQFLAEWPHRVVLLRTDGKIALVRRRPPQVGETLEVLDVGAVAHAVSNPRTDVVIVATSRGEIRGLRPLGAEPLTPADFRPPPPPPPPSPVTPEPEAEVAEEEAETEEPAEPTRPRLTPEESLLVDPLRSRR